MGSIVELRELSARRGNVRAERPPNRNDPSCIPEISRKHFDPIAPCRPEPGSVVNRVERNQIDVAFQTTNKLEKRRRITIERIVHAFQHQILDHRRSCGVTRGVEERFT
jgi:hypothetical protein